MRIAIIYRDFDSNAGDAFDVRSIAINLAQLNNTVEIYCSYNCKNMIEHPNITYFRRRYSFLSIIDLHTRRKRIDFAHLFCGYIASLYWIAIYLQLAKTPYCYSGFGQVSEQGLERSFWKKKLYTLFCLKSILKHAKFIQVCSIQERNYVMKIGAKRAVIAPLSLEGYELTATASSSERSFITFIGRLDIWQKGLDLFLEVVKELGPLIKEKGYKVVLAGRSEEASIQYLASIVDEYQLGELVNVRVDITEAEKLTLLNSTLIFYHPSRIEGFARSMREALSMKIPTLTTSGSNIGDTINKYQVGLSTEFDVDQQVIALKKLLSTESFVGDWNGLFDYLSWSNTANILQSEYCKHCKACH